MSRSLIKVKSSCCVYTVRMEVLDLSRNNLTKLEPGALNVAAHLLHVDLSGNQLSDVGGAFAGLRRLSRLDLRQNRLSALTSNSLSGLSALRYLRLDDNRVSAVDGRAFVALGRLVYLVLRGNPLGAAASRFHFSSHLLSYLDLSDCALERFPAGLPASVRYLQLRRNRLRTPQPAAADAATGCGRLRAETSSTSAPS